MTPQEIDRREAEVRAGKAPVRGAEQIRANSGRRGAYRLLLALRLLVGLEYGLIFLAGLVILAFPFSYFDPPRSKLETYIAMSLRAASFFVMAATSYAVMTHTLKSLGDELAAKNWTLIVLGLAPFSAILYNIAEDRLPPTLQFPIIDFASPIVGFCMPFILFTLWLQYRYRQDEF